MALMLFDLRSEEASSQYGPDAWLVAGRTMSIPSVAETVVRRELWRYLRGEVEGRSFLIAGHRGSGKTTAILRAVADVEEAILAPEAAAQQAAWTQRPLLVKLHGPSLFSGRLPEASVPKRASAAEGADKSDAVASGGSARRKAPLQDPVKASRDTAEDQTRAALVQIVTALYRALCTEVARRFRTHAGQPRADGGAPAATRSAERLELAARLRLELDKAPGPEALRGYYMRMGRLRQGVLWPDPVARGADQGAREIVAVATAAQAFQVCIGAITYEQVSKDTGERALRFEGRTDLNLKGVLDRLAGIAAGIAVGTAFKVTETGVAPSLAAGVAGGILTTLTLSWSSSRTAKRDESAEYRFIRDYSLATLDRDLPEVIRRLRDAGLAPVFVIDELDKLADVAPSLEQLLDRLKNLTTDYGFFCFLTNRSYYEDIWWRLQKSAYPKEFTYFSNLLFVGSGPAEVLAYLLRIVRQAPGSDLADAGTLQRDATGWMAFAFAVRHRTRLNTIALMRELSRAFDENRRMLTPPDRVTSVRGRLQVAVQIAIDLCFDGPNLSERTTSDPLFGQLAVDALYRISAAWEAGEAEVRLGPEDLATYLRSRSDSATRAAGSPADGTPVDAASAAEGLTREELARLSHSAIEVADLLTDFGKLQAAAQGYWTARRRQLLEGIEPPAFVEAGVSAFGQLLEALLPREADGILEATADKGRYVFRVDPYGVVMRGANEVARTEKVSRTPSDLLGTCEAILAAFGRLGVSIAGLVEAGCLPATVDEVALGQAIDRVRMAAEVDRLASDDVNRELPTLRNFVEVCVAFAPTLGWATLLAMLVSPGASSTEQGLRAVARHLPIMEIRPAKDPVALEGALRDRISDIPPGVAIPPPFDDEPASVAEWARAISAAVDENAPRPRGVRDEAAEWQRWRSRVLGALGKPSFGDPGKAAPQLVMDDLRQAAEGVWPGALFRYRIGEMSVLDWSSLALRAFPAARAKGYAPRRTSGRGQPKQQPPAWTLVAALAALGFDRSILEHARALAGDEGADLEGIVQAAQVHGPDRKGVLWVVRDVKRTLSLEAAPKESAGVLAVTVEELRRNHPLLRWLSDRGAFDVVTEDEVE